MTSIYQVKPGDYIQVIGTREYKRIQKIDPEIAQQEPLRYRRWTITTEDGGRFEMGDVALYLTKAEYDQVTGRPRPHADMRSLMR